MIGCDYSLKGQVLSLNWESDLTRSRVKWASDGTLVRRLGIFYLAVRNLYCDSRVKEDCPQLSNALRMFTFDQRNEIARS